MTELSERLGFGPDDLVLIIHADGMGSSHAATAGVYEVLETGVATSASLMVPCPWAREAASRYGGEDIGVDLTLNAEHDRYRWGPITNSPSLLDGDGGFPRTMDDLWEHADLSEVRRELRAQIERAILWGFDVSHLHSHLDTLTLRPEFFDVYLDLAIDFRLPVRLSGADQERMVGFPFRKLAAEEGVIFPDHFLSVPSDGPGSSIDSLIDALEPGVTDLQVHPAVDSPELRAITSAWHTRVRDHALLAGGGAFEAACGAAGVKTIGYRALRELQRTTD